MALAYYLTKYCALGGKGSHHCNLMDVELQKDMRIILETVNTMATSQYRTAAEQVTWNTKLPIHKYGINKPRLKSLHPFLERGTSIKAQRHLQSSILYMAGRMRKNLPINGELVSKDAYSVLPGSHSPHIVWTWLNRIQTSQG